MIFVTVGTQGHFDRLVRTVDEWAGLRGRNDIFAQTGPSAYRPRNFNVKQFLDPIEFREYVESASVVVAHAGMGSIITALECGKHIIVMPRRGYLKEHRNDHLVSTAKRFGEQGRIAVAFNEQELLKQLDDLKELRDAERLSAHAPPDVIDKIRNFIEVRVGSPLRDRTRSLVGARRRILDLDEVSADQSP